MIVQGKHYRTLWFEGTKLHLINQLLLPWEFSVVTSDHWETTAEAIKTMVVRGAGAIGAAAGFAMAQAALAAPANTYRDYLYRAAEAIRSTRPTAYNLFYAVNKVLDAAVVGAKTAVEEAQRLADENLDDGLRIGQQGLPLIKPDMKILTHCNAGWLAFVDWGTALAPVYQASRNGLNPFVWAGETRPRGQGARLTAWELFQEGINHTVIADNAVASLMAAGQVDLVITGADRIAMNGDTANKTGTLDRAILAKHYQIPFYVAAPLSTFDPDCFSGDNIPIEYRSGAEVTHQSGPDAENILHTVAVTNPGSPVVNPSFDVTPARLISGIITPQEIINPCREEIEKLIKPGLKG